MEYEQDNDSKGATENDFNDEVVKCIVNHLSLNLSEKSEQDSKNELIKKLFEAGFSVNNPDGARLYDTQVLQQAMWAAMTRIKPLDFTLHGRGRPEYVEKIVTAGVSTVLQEGGYVRSFRDKGGVVQSLFVYGDGFQQIGTSDDDDPFPVQFTPISNNNVFPDALSTAIRAGDGRSCRKLCVIISYDIDEVKSMFDDDSIMPGRLPKNMDQLSDTDRSYEQTSEAERLTEVGYWYDISKKDEECHAIIAGANCRKKKDLKGEKYPFKDKKKKGYIPVFQYLCYPSLEGFWNHGIGDMLYKLAILSQRLINMGAMHIFNNILPIGIVNMPQGSAASFFNNLAAAEELKASGKRPYVPVEYDPNSPGSSAVTTSSIIVQGLINEWQILLQRLDREMARLGLNLDETERGDNMTASQVIAEEESKNAWAKQVMENNASETKAVVQTVMNMMIEFVDDDDDTPLNFTTKIYDDDGTEIPTDKMTLGMVAKELKENHYTVRVNDRSGANPSNVMVQAQISKALQFAQPGTKAYYKLVTQMANVNDRDLSIDDFMPPQAPPPPPGGGTPEEVENSVDPSQTDRLRVNPRSDKEVPI